MYPWFVYLNNGGVFGQQPIAGLPAPVQKSPSPDYILYQPTPLETTQGDSSITSRPVGATQALQDLDGDGFADALVSNGAASQWLLYHGDRVSQLSSATGNTNQPYVFNLAPSQSSSYYINFYDIGGTGQTSSMLDLNGDGLVDRWFGATAASATVAFNDGVRFRDPAEVTTPVRPSVESTSFIDPGPCVEVQGGMCWTGTPQHQFILVGYRFSTQRPFDIDADGRADIVRSNGAPWFNQGGQFASPGHNRKSGPQTKAKFGRNPRRRQPQRRPN
jgi:hypothetical protein